MGFMTGQGEGASKSSNSRLHVLFLPLSRRYRTYKSVRTSPKVISIVFDLNIALKIYRGIGCPLEIILEGTQGGIYDISEKVFNITYKMRCVLLQTFKLHGCYRRWCKLRINNTVWVLGQGVGGTLLDIQNLGRHA